MYDKRPTKFKVFLADEALLNNENVFQYRKDQQSYRTHLAANGHHGGHPHMHHGWH